MTLAAVHTLYDTNHRVIPEMLRGAADSIEQEPDIPDCSPTAAVVVIQVARNGQLRTYPFGDTDDDRVVGILSRALHETMADIREAVEC